jgi:hypothetical protein
LFFLQERAKELAQHEEQLEDWKKRFKSEALRQIREREAALSDWQAQLDAKRSELEELKNNMEVCHPNDSKRSRTWLFSCCGHAEAVRNRIPRPEDLKHGSFPLSAEGSEGEGGPAGGA